MYKKFYTILKEDFKIENINKIFCKELKKSYKIEINYIKEDSLSSETYYYLSSRKLEEYIEEIIKESESNIIVTFFYKNRQNITKRNINPNKLIKKELMSLFDIRKINNSFNYGINEKEQEELFLSFFDKNCNEIIKQKVEEIFNISAEIDDELYTNKKSENVEKRKIELKRKILELKGKIADEDKQNFLFELLESFEKKYDLIFKLEKCNYLDLQETFPKKVNIKIFENLSEKSKNELLEKIVLDETFDTLYTQSRLVFSKYLKRNFSKGLTQDKIKTFEKFSEKYNLKEILFNKKEEFKKGLKDKVNESTFRKLEKVLSIDLIEKLIICEKDIIFKNREKIYPIFKIISKDINQDENLIDLKKNILKKFYERLFNEFFLNCYIELNKNQNDKLIMKRDIVGNIKKNRLKKKFDNIFQEILDIIYKDETLYDEFSNRNIVPDEIYIILKNKEKEILDIMQNVNQMNKTKLKKIEEEIIKKIDSVIEKKLVVDIQFEKALEIIFDPVLILDQIVEHFLEYKRIELYKEFMEIKSENISEK